MLPFALLVSVIAVGAIFTGLIVLSIHLEQKRTEAMRAAASQLGMQFSADANPALSSKLQSFALFNRGHGRKMKNVMAAETEAVRLSLFDYQYTTSNGKNSHTHRFSLIAMEFASIQLPSFTLRPEGMLDAIGSVLGLQDIDFLDDPAFSRLFVLKGNHEPAIRDFFNVELRRALTELPGSHVESSTSTLIFYRGGRKRPDQMKKYMEEGFKLFSAISNQAT